MKTAELCEINANTTTFGSVYMCYTYYANKNLVATILEICLGIFTAFFNCLVIKIIYWKKNYSFMHRSQTINKTQQPCNIK